MFMFRPQNHSHYDYLFQLSIEAASVYQKLRGHDAPIKAKHIRHFFIQARENWKIRENNTFSAPVNTVMRKLRYSR
jgi:hypothetical protein